VRQRVLAYVTRERAGRKELLVFEDPEDPGTGLQLPAGRLDPGETLEQCLLRELHEEAGLEGLGSCWRSADRIGRRSTRTTHSKSG
jgi:8-oxo-dGTP pyrophosphatase MutT (NUDIX family)